jgi:uncharacterized membrane protein YcaP (DUF421 family)
VNEEDIRLTDLSRILLGNVAWPFLIEALARIVFVYLLLLLAMRLMGKRMASTLSRNELAALVSLAAATGAVIQSPERGLLPAIVIVLIVVAAQRLVALLAIRNKRLERATQGDLSVLVDDGQLELEVMERCDLSREQVFSQLRTLGFTNLGMVRRLYMEAGGSFSFLRFDSPRAGLSLVPACDEELRSAQRRSQDFVVCDRCGHLEHRTSSEPESCSRCRGRVWLPPVEDA